MTIVEGLETLRAGIIERLPTTPEPERAAAQRVLDAVDELLAALFAVEIVLQGRP